jgi:hypothetical protein
VAWQTRGGEWRWQPLVEWEVAGPEEEVGRDVDKQTSMSWRPHDPVTMYAALRYEQLDLKANLILLLSMTYVIQCTVGSGSEPVRTGSQNHWPPRTSNRTDGPVLPRA